MATTRTLFTKLADAAQKTTVIGLVGWCGFLTYQAVSNIYEHQRAGDVEKMSDQYWKDVNDAVKKDYEKGQVIDNSQARDWYDEEDDSYLKNRVRPKLPPTSGKEKS